MTEDEEVVGGCYSDRGGASRGPMADTLLLPPQKPLARLCLKPKQTASWECQAGNAGDPEKSRRMPQAWFGAFPGAFGLGRAQPQRRGTSP